MTDSEPHLIQRKVLLLTFCALRQKKNRKTRKQKKNYAKAASRKLSKKKTQYKTQKGSPKP